jgi:hypothetical protein
VEEIAFAVVAEVADGGIGDLIVEYFGEYFADVFAAEVFSEEGAGQDDAFVYAADVDFLVADVDHAGGADCGAEAGHDAFEVDV